MKLIDDLDRSHLPGPLGAPRSLAISPDGAHLACTTSDGELVVWDLGRRALVWRHPLETTWSEVVWWGEGVLVRGRSGVQQLHLGTGERTTVWEPDDYRVGRPIASNGEQVLLSDDHRIVLVGAGEPRRTLGPWLDDVDRPVAVRSASLDAAGERVLVSLDDFAVIATLDGAELLRLDSVTAAAFTANPDIVATSGRDGAHLRDVATGKSVAVLSYQFDSAVPTPHGLLTWDHESVALYRDDGTEVWASRYHDGVRGLATAGDRFYTSTNLPWIGVRSVETGVLIRVLPAGGGGTIGSVRFAPDSQSLAAVDGAGRLVLWGLDEQRPCSVADASSLQPDDAPLAIGSLNGPRDLAFFGGRIHLFAGEWFSWPVDELDGEPRAARCLRDLSANGQFGVDDRDADEAALLVRLDGTEVAELPEHDRYGTTLIPGPEGRHVLFADDAGSTGTLRLWEVGAGFRAELSIDVRPDLLQFAPDATIVGRAQDYVPAEDTARTVYFRWDPQTGGVSRWMTPVESLSSSAAVAGRSVCVLWSAEEVSVFDDAGELRYRFEPGLNVRDVAVSPDEKLLAIGTDVGVIFVADLETGATRMVCHTADGGWWSFSDGEFDYTQGSWT